MDTSIKNSMLSEVDRVSFELLTGGGTTSKHPTEIVEKGGQGKFTVDGDVLPFPGNTFLCHIDPKSDAYDALCRIQDTLMSGPHASHFAFLPKPSFHMTIFNGVSGMPLGSDGMPKALPNETDITVINDHFKRVLQAKSFPQRFCVSAHCLLGGYSIRLKGASDLDERSLRSIRDSLRDLTGLRRPSHDTYEFHTTLAYRISWMSAQAALEVIELANHAFDEQRHKLEKIQLGPIEFCEMDNMYEFRPMALLG